MKWLVEIFASGNVPEEIEAETFNSDTIFPGRNRMGFMEKFLYLRLISFIVVHEGNLDKIEAFYTVIGVLDISEKLTHALEKLFSLERLDFLAKYFNTNK